MSQDLLDDFFSSPRPASVTPNSTPLSPALSSQLTRPVSSFQGCQHTVNTTAFNDLLGLFDSQPSGSAPRSRPARMGLTQPQRPASFHGSIPPGVDRDPFAALRNFTPNHASTSTERPISISTFGSFFPTSPQGSAVEEEGDDDFGDFASASPSGGSILTPSAVATPVSANPMSSRSSSPPPPPTPPKPNRGRKYSESDLFGDFVTSPAAPSPQPPFPSPPSKVPRIPLKSFVSTPAPSPLRRPPKPQGSIPPVSVLLGAFPPLFSLPQEYLLDKMTDLSFPLRQRVLAHHKTRQFLDGVCEVGRVAGRIIAGRKRRANRVSSSGKDGGGGGGMKLGNRPKAAWELQDEEREVKEVCRLWKEGSGRLKAAMGIGIPEFGDEAFRNTRTDACKLCGLGRDELLPGLKEQTERLKWWDREWSGHGGCRGFWEAHGKPLVSAAR